MDNTSQILERSAELFSGQRLLLVNPAADGLTRSLPADWTLWSWDYASSRGLAGALPEDRLESERSEWESRAKLKASDLEG